MKRKNNTECFTDQYLILRRMIGIIGILMPLILLFGSLIIYGKVQRSFSECYDTALRDIFVGLTMVIGFFISAYKGYDKLDKIVCITIGVNLFFTAIWPVTSPTKWISIMHFVTAGIAFAGMSYMSIFLFTKSNKVLPGREKQNRNTLYRICGIVMLTCLFLIGFIPVVWGYDFNNKLQLTFWLEFIILWAFSLPWYVKGQTILKDNHYGAY